MAAARRTKATPKAHPHPVPAAAAHAPPTAPATADQRRNVAWFVAATVVPFLAGFVLALGLFALTDELQKDGQEIAEDVIGYLFIAAGLALAVLGWLRRDGRRGQLLLVAAGSVLASVGFVHPAAPFWMTVAGVVFLAAALAVPLWPASRLGHAALMPLAAIAFLQSLPLGTDSTAIALTILAHWILSWLRIEPASPARRPVAGALFLLVAAVAVLGWYFVVVGPDGRRIVFALVATAFAVLLSGLLWHPRLRGLALPSRAA